MEGMVLVARERLNHAIKTKKDAMDAEVERSELGSFYDYDVQIIEMKSRVLRKSVDIYKTGYPRLACYYECFDLHKFLLYR